MSDRSAREQIAYDEFMENKAKEITEISKGMVLVPREPTEEMLRAVRSTWKKDGKNFPDTFYVSIWNAMIAAGRKYD